MRPETDLLNTDCRMSASEFQTLSAPPPQPGQLGIIIFTQRCFWSTSKPEQVTKDSERVHTFRQSLITDVQCAVTIQPNESDKEDPLLNKLFRNITVQGVLHGVSVGYVRIESCRFFSTQTKIKSVSKNH